MRRRATNRQEVRIGSDILVIVETEQVKETCYGVVTRKGPTEIYKVDPETGIEMYQSEIKNDGSEFKAKPSPDPADGPWQPACGGSEKPFVCRGYRLQYMFQPSTGTHAYLDLKADRFLTNEEANRILSAY